MLNWDNKSILHLLLNTFIRRNLKQCASLVSDEDGVIYADHREWQILQQDLVAALLLIRPKPYIMSLVLKTVEMRSEEMRLPMHTAPTSVSGYAIQRSITDILQYPQCESFSSTRCVPSASRSIMAWLRTWTRRQSPNEPTDEMARASSSTEAMPDFRTRRTSQFIFIPFYPISFLFLMLLFYIFKSLSAALSVWTENEPPSL